MAVPNVSYKVEIAWTSNWLTPAASRVWIDVSNQVELDQGMTITHGRSDEVTTADANTLTLTLDNKDGSFTWGNAASPYYPNVKLGRPIRVTATVGGVDYVRFTGFVDEWPVEWPGESASFATATLTASSRLGRIGLSSPLTATVDQAVLSTDPVYYWPLADAAGSTAAVERLGGVVNLAPTATGVTFSVGAEDEPTETLGVDDRGAVKLTGTTVGENGGKLEVSFPAIPANAIGAGFAFGLFVKVLNPGGVSLDDVIAYVSGQRFGSTTQGAIRLDRVGPSGLGVAYPSDLSTAASSVHHVLLNATRTAGPTVQIDVYFDGALVSGSPYAPGGDVDISFVGLEWPTSATDSRNVLFGRVGIWGRPLTAAEAEGVALAGLGAYAGDTTDERLQRYAAWARVPSAEVVTTASPIALAAVQADAAQVEALMRDVETAEAGVLYDDRYGNLVLTPRASRYHVNPALTVAFTTDIVKGYVPKVDRQGLANVGTGKGPAGNDLTYEDRASRDDYGDADYSVETTALNPDEPFQLVAWRINGNAQPRPRVPAPEFSVIDFIGGSIAVLLSLDVGSKLRLTNAPSQSPGAASADYFVEGYSEEMGVGIWSISPNLSPVTLEDSVLILDSATKGLLDTNVIAL